MAIGGEEGIQFRLQNSFESFVVSNNTLSGKHASVRWTKNTLENNLSFLKQKNNSFLSLKLRNKMI